jgi:glycosyltransferase involved in cell wall biosynthesis
LGTHALRWLDKRSADGVDHFVANSACVADRIRRVYARDAEVVYPPVSAKGPGSGERLRERFLLHLGRLVPYKRVDLAIGAAERLQIPLVIAGDGPDRARLEHLAGRHTRFVGQVSEVEAARLLSTCAAFMFCAEEDFGIAPVEANAHGTPVVGFRRGGLAETMLDGVTAVFFDEQSVDAVTKATHRALQQSWDTALLRKNAQRFSPQHFREAFARSIVRALDPDQGAQPPLNTYRLQADVQRVG